VGRVAPAAISEGGIGSARSTTMGRPMNTDRAMDADPEAAAPGVDDR
jgi:hypothetical protein